MSNSPRKRVVFYSILAVNISTSLIVIGIQGYFWRKWNSKPSLIAFLQSILSISLMFSGKLINRTNFVVLISRIDTIFACLTFGLYLYYSDVLYKDQDRGLDLILTIHQGFVYWIIGFRIWTANILQSSKGCSKNERFSKLLILACIFSVSIWAREDIILSIGTLVSPGMKAAIFHGIFYGLMDKISSKFDEGRQFITMYTGFACITLVSSSIIVLLDLNSLGEFVMKFGESLQGYPDLIIFTLIPISLVANLMSEYWLLVNLNRNNWAVLSLSKTCAGSLGFFLWFNYGTDYMTTKINFISISAVFSCIGVYYYKSNRFLNNLTSSYRPIISSSDRIRDKFID